MKFTDELNEETHENMDKKDDKHFDDVWQKLEKLIGDTNANNPKNKNYKKEMGNINIELKRSRNLLEKAWKDALKGK